MGSAGATTGTTPPTSPAKSPALSGSAPSDTTGTGTSPAPAALPPIAHVWLVVLPGQGFASAQAQPTADPYLSQQLLGQGLLLSAYSPLDASALGTDAALLSGQSAPQLSVLTAPGCHEETGSSTCPPGSPGGLASADRYLREEVPQITASAAYREGGLLVLAFAPPPASTQPLGAGSAGAGTPAGASTPGASAGATLAAQPQGAWVLSPFLRTHGRSANPFHPATPRKNLEEVFRG